ncbi:unnamed protein product [Ectocarpus sp. 12 AP-2014]
MWTRGGRDTHTQLLLAIGGGSERRGIAWVCASRSVVLSLCSCGRGGLLWRQAAEGGIHQIHTTTNQQHITVVPRTCSTTYYCAVYLSTLSMCENVCPLLLLLPE